MVAVSSDAPFRSTFLCGGDDAEGGEQLLDQFRGRRRYLDQTVRTLHRRRKPPLEVVDLGQGHDPLGYPFGCQCRCRVPQRLLQLIDQLACPHDRIAGLCRAAVDLDEQFVGLPEYLRVDLLHTGADDPHAGDSRQADDDPKDAQRPQGESKQTSASVHEQ